MISSYPRYPLSLIRQLMQAQQCVRVPSARVSYLDEVLNNQLFSVMQLAFHWLSKRRECFFNVFGLVVGLDIGHKLHVTVSHGIDS